MAVPRIESIAANIKTTIDGITVGNGFEQTLTGIRPSRNDLQKELAFDDLDCYIFQQNPEQLSQVISKDTRNQNFFLIIITRDADDDTDPMDTRKNQIWADVFRAMRVDRTRNSLAINTTMGDFDFFTADDGSFSGVAMDVIVMYRTNQDNPYNA